MTKYSFKENILRRAGIIADHFIEEVIDAARSFYSLFACILIIAFLIPISIFAILLTLYEWSANLAERHTIKGINKLFHSGEHRD